MAELTEIEKKNRRKYLNTPIDEKEAKEFAQEKADFEKLRIAFEQGEELVPVEEKPKADLGIPKPAKAEEKPKTT